MKMRLLFFTLSICLQTGCSPPTPLECDSPKAKNALIDKMKVNLATKTFMLTHQSISPDDLSLNIESVKTVKKDKDNPFYRKCEMSFTMPGMMFSSSKIYEIDKNEDGDIIVKFSM